MKIINLLQSKNGCQRVEGVMLVKGHCVINDCRYVLSPLDVPDYVVRDDTCESVTYRWTLQTEGEWQKQMYGIG